MENRLYLYGEDLKITNALVDGDLLKISGYCCHYGKANLNMERTDANSFKTWFGMYNSGQIRPCLNYGHTDQLIGGIDSFDSMKDGLFMTAHINRKIGLVKDMVEPMIMAGDLDSFSTEGWIMNGWDGIEEYEDNTYYVKDFMLTGVAVVAVPADPDAKFTFANFMQNCPKPEPKPLKSRLLYVL